MLEKSYNVSVRRMFDLPRESSSYLIESLTDCPHLVKRFLKFVDKLNESEKTRKMLNLIKHDVRSVTGRFLRNIMDLVNKDSIDSLTSSDADRIVYQETPENCHWKIGFVKEITDIKFGQCYLDSFKRKELNVILRNVCVT